MLFRELAHTLNETEPRIDRWEIRDAQGVLVGFK